MMSALNYIDAVQTPAAGGAAFQILSDRPCVAVTVTNPPTNAGVNIDIQLNGAGNVVTIGPGVSKMIYGLNNAKEVGVRRTDGAVTQVPVQAEVLNSPVHLM
jgi:hypothetical protein